MRAVVLLALACLSRDLFKAVIHKQLGPVRACYERVLAEGATGDEGRLVVRFIIEADGHVSEAQVTRSELKSESLQACVVRAVLGWRFPPPRGGGRITVTYPFVFKASGVSGAHPQGP